MADSAYFMKSTPPSAFSESCMCVTDILKMDMWKFNNEKMILINYIFFSNLANFWIIVMHTSFHLFPFQLRGQVQSP